MHLWDLETGAELRRFNGHESVVSSLALLPSGRFAVSGSRDKTVRLWDLDIGACLCLFVADAPIQAVAAASETVLVAGDASGRLHILELRGGR